MSWVVTATDGPFTDSLETGSLVAAFAWANAKEIGGWTVDGPHAEPGGRRHLTVINGGRGEGVSNAAPAAKGL